jgi:peptide/nickel transport system substrate-binding protein
MTMGMIETMTGGAARDGTDRSSMPRRLLLFACLAACAPRSQSEPGVLLIEEKEQTASFIRNFNPLVEVGDLRWPALHSMYEPLFIYNPLDGAYVPWLGTAYEWSADHRHLRIDLRRGVRWSDGAPFTARDVAFTFGLLERFHALDLRGVGEFVEGVTAIDDHTVDIAFRRVFIPGFYYLAQQPIVPEHIWKDVTDPVSWANPHPVATGPFTEVSSFETQSYQVEQNPYYWQLPERPQVKAIRFLAFPGNDQASFALVSGEVDWAGSFVPAIDRIFAAEDREHHHFWFPPIDGGVLLYANTTRAPYDDVRVRKALSMAIDRELVVEVGMHGYTRPADATGLSDAHRRYKDARATAAGDWIHHDLARASALLDEAGLPRGRDGIRRLPDGSRWQVTIQVPSGWSDWVRATQVIARGLRAAGIDARMKAHDFNAWYEQVQNGEFTMAIGWAEPYPTPYGYYRAMMSTATVKPLGISAPENWHRFGSPDADVLLRALEQTADPAVERRLINELQQLFVERVPAIPLFPGPLWGAYNSTRFTGFPDAGNPYAPLSPNMSPQALLVLTRLVPR